MLLTEAEVRRRTGYSRTTIWRKVRSGEFPAPVITGSNSKRYFEDEIDAYLETLPRCHYAPSAPASSLFSLSKLNAHRSDATLREQSERRG